MDRNEAIAQIAEAAIAGIAMTAENAIKLLDGGSFAEAVATTMASTTTTVASTGEKRPRGRPRKTEAVAAPAPAPVAEEESVVEEAPAVEVDEMDVYHADVFDVEKHAFPVYSDEWFAENLEEARNHCRALLSARMAEIGPDETRKEVLTVTQKSRVTDFDAMACAKFYRAITRALVNV